MNKRFRRLSLTLLALGLGACDAVLSIPERSSDSTVVCREGSCQCAAGHGDCDGDESNGCEADLHQVMSCGGCGNQCLNGGCPEGVCVCNSGFSNCDGLTGNGCETDLSSAGNCGGCGNRCRNGNCIDARCDCKPGFLDCNGLAEDGCETSVDDDPAHCGACGHGCLGGSCEAGRCRPVQIFKGIVGDVALVGNDLYFVSDYSSIKKLSKSGDGKATEICSASINSQLTISGGFVFGVSYAEGVVSCPLAGGNVKTVVSSTPAGGFFSGVAVGGGWVYYPVYDSQTSQIKLLRALADGASGTPKVVAKLDSSAGVFADAAHVYWISLGDVVILNHDLSSSDTLSLAPYYADNIIAVDAKRLYLGAYDSAENEAVFFVAPLDGGAPQLRRRLFCSYSCLVAADEQHLYLANQSSGILRRTLLTASGEEEEESEILLLDEAFTSSRIMLDDKAIYWSTQKGIFRLAK